MNHFAILLTMIGSANVAVIGLYWWSFKNIGKIYELVNAHKNEADIHTNKKEFMVAAVCDERFGAMKEDVAEIKADVKCILQKV